MENIILIKGKVKYTITIDPTVWIFDDRKVDLSTFFHGERVKRNELDEYTKEISSHWDREIIEGAKIPPTNNSEKMFKKESLLTGTFGIPFKPFLLNAQPNNEAKKLVVITANTEEAFELSTASEFILGFSKNGKPLKNDGPIHIYFGDGSNQQNPIKNVKEFRVE